MTRAEAVAELESYRAYPPGWDSYKADPIDPSAVDLALKIVAADGILTDSFDCAPTSDGGVALEWESDGKTLTVEVYAAASRRRVAVG